MTKKTICLSSIGGIVLLAIIGLAAYFGWYVPRQPAYTYQRIYQAVEDKDVAKVFKYVDVNSIVKLTADREFATNPKLKDNKLAQALKGTVISVTSAAIRNMITNAVLDQPKSHTQSDDIASYIPLSEDTYNVIHSLQTKRNRIDLNSLHTQVDKGGQEAQSTIVVEDTKLHKTVTVELKLHKTDEGYWRIYDIPNLPALLQQLDVLAQVTGNK